jgi:hypothetical protein
VPNFETKSVAVVIPIAFGAEDAQEAVKVSAIELSAACGGHLVWVGPEGVLATGTPDAEVRLDYDGRTFVAALAGGCASARVQFVAELLAAPFTTEAASFFIEEAPEDAPVPKVTAVKPDEGPESGGSTVMLTGVHLAGTKRVDFGTSVAKSFKIKSESSIEAVAPAGHGYVYVTVTTPVGTSQRGDGGVYEYLPRPSVSSVTPDSGLQAGGTAVAITGKGFLNGATTVAFGSFAAREVTVHSEESLTATTPPGTGTVNVTVATTGGTSAGTHRFSYR